MTRYSLLITWITNTPPLKSHDEKQTEIDCKGCFPLGGIFRAQRNFSLFVSSQAEPVNSNFQYLER